MLKQMDEVSGYAWVVRANVQKVGRDIYHYRQSLDETDAFLTKIENRGFVYLSFKKSAPL